MKKLFIIKNIRPGEVKRAGVDVPFDNKMEAKRVRDMVGGVEKGFYISRGPDHIGPHGQGKTPKMRRQPK